MRPIILHVNRVKAAAPVLTAAGLPGAPINLTWTDGTPVAAPSTLGNPANEIGFRIERAIGPAGGLPGAYSVLANGLANTTAYVDNTTVVGIGYWYRVVAYNAAGDSTSNVVMVSFGTAPAAPTLLRTTAIASTRVDLAWNDNANNENGFYVERGLGSGSAPTYVRIGTVAANIRAYSDATASPSTTYSYRVIAFNSAGNSAPSNRVIATTLGAVPAAPTGLTATVLTTGTRFGASIRLDWVDNANNETGYEVYRSTNQTTWTRLTTTGANVRTYTSGGLTRGVTYYYRVRAINAAGASAYSNIASARPSF